jgi:hypothetical protein
VNLIEKQSSSGNGLASGNGFLMSGENGCRGKTMKKN